MGGPILLTVETTTEPLKRSDDGEPDYLGIAIYLWERIVSDRSDRPAILKSAEFFLAAQKKGINLIDVNEALWAPRFSKVTPKSVTRPAMMRSFLAPTMRKLRGERTLAEVCRLLKISNESRFGHWENGRRDIPLELFLRAVDVLGNRLPACCQTLDSDIALDQFGAATLAPRFFHRFFDNPWAPTVHLAFYLPKYKDFLIQPAMEAIAKDLRIDLKLVEEAVELLISLRLLTVENSKVSIVKGQFYALPAHNAEQIKKIHHHWFSLGAEMAQKRPGFYKVEQAVLSRESKEKIIGWMGELRERIREETKNTESLETVIHINWQLSELL